MKRLLVVIEGLADEVSADLGGKTPLEAAKTPTLDKIASEGRLGQALFTPSSLPPSADVAFFSILGINPVGNYTGIAPLDAVAAGLQMNPHSTYFRCDLVTVSDEKLVDANAGFISSKESEFLLKAVAGCPEAKDFNFFVHENNRHIASSDVFSSSQKDNLNISSPKSMIKQPVSKYFSQLKTQPVLKALVERSVSILESHEINRVRVDLGENPANMIWLWGQGKCPKIANFEAQYGLSAGVVAPGSFLNGLCTLMGMTVYESVQKALEERDFVLVFLRKDEKHLSEDAKSKLRRIEEADRAIEKFRELLDKFSLCRIAITGDMPFLAAKRSNVHGQVPLAMCGAGIASSQSVAFDEKSAMAGNLVYDQGHLFLPYFLNS